ncbi:MAG: hypothetical protein N3I35_18810 [Clostridia bacterium]|nr:hypothetical protein [Clostridia bacterium]
MKKLEIKEFGLISIFKVSIYIMVIPMALFILIGIIMCIAAILLKSGQFLFIGAVYAILPVVAIPFYGAIYMLIGFIYNTFSKRFGGLEITIQERE